MLKLGTTDINGLYLGSTAINQAYLGSTEVFGQTLLDFSGVETQLGRYDLGYQDYKYGVSFNSDGTKMFASDTTASAYYIQQWDLTTPYDASTATNLVQVNVGLACKDIQVIGNYLLLIAGTTFRRYLLNSGSISGMSLQHSGTVAGNNRFYMTTDGTHYMISDNPGKIYLATNPFVIDDINDTLISSASGFHYAYGLSDDGKYIVNYTTVYNLTAPYDLNTKVSVGTLSYGGLNIRGIRMTPNFDYYIYYGDRATNYPSLYGYSTGQFYN